MAESIAQTARPHRVRLVVVVGAVVVAVAGFAVASAMSGKDQFTCENRMTLLGGGDGTGDPTRGEALDRAALTLVNLVPRFAEDADGTKLAVHSATGPDRYDPGSGALFIDDDIAARFTVSELPDGTFAVGTIETCGPDPQ